MIQRSYAQRRDLQVASSVVRDVMQGEVRAINPVKIGSLSLQYTRTEGGKRRSAVAKADMIDSPFSSFTAVVTALPGSFAPCICIASTLLFIFVANPGQSTIHLHCPV